MSKPQVGNGSRANTGRAWRALCALAVAGLAGTAWLAVPLAEGGTVCSDLGASAACDEVIAAATITGNQARDSQDGVGVHAAWLGNFDVRGGRLRVYESDGPTGAGVLELSNGLQSNWVFTHSNGLLVLRASNPDDPRPGWPGAEMSLSKDGAARFNGAVFANVDTGTGDVAEPVVGEGLLPGTVVELNGHDVTGKLRVKPSDSPYAREVAGVISTKPSLVLAGGGLDSPLAVTGIVPVKVVGPIRVGDLLTTSATPGRAMACTDPIACFGATFGKATQAHEGAGEGTVTVLLSLG